MLLIIYLKSVDIKIQLKMFLRVKFFQKTSDTKQFCVLNIYFFELALCKKPVPMGYIENDDDDTAIGGRKLVIMRLLLNTQNIFFVLVIVLLCTVSVIFRKCKRTAALSRPSGCLSQTSWSKFLYKQNTHNVYLQI